jgi:serine/threonine-protein phosphatase 2A activator
LLDALEAIKRCAQETEPLPMDTQRYGNKAFRDFFQNICALQHPLLPAFSVKMLNASFGNATRLDYGTGHELFFLIACLTAVQSQEISQDFAAVLGGRVICNLYLDLARFIQRRFSLEPAGSHGVWGLDDYQFAPFLLGSAQLIGFDEQISTAAGVEPATFNNLRLQSEFVYLNAVAHIHRLKTRGCVTLPFANHSPLLHSISGVPTWQRVHEGLGRMYLKEVLGKLPVVQHLQFDSELFPINL